MEKNKTFIVRDLRQKSRYTIDDEYLNGYAKLCGVFGTAVYNSLCRHASKNQECFPSIELIAEQHNINRKSVLKGLKNLNEWGIIEITKERDKVTKRQKNNVYILLDKSQWKPKPSPSEGLGKLDPSPPQGLGAESLPGTDPSPSQSKSRVPQEDCKDTQFKDSHSKDIAAGAAENSFSPKEEDTKCKIDDCNNRVEEGKDYCKIHKPMDLKQFIVWCAESNQKHINIIGDWAETVRPNFRNQGQWSGYISRNVRVAKLLIPFDRDQLEDGFKYIKDGITGKWLKMYTLETLYKFVTGEKITQ